MKAALALNVKFPKRYSFDRKTISIRDNPKAYQILQFDQPIGLMRWTRFEVEIEVSRQKEKHPY